MLVACQQKGPPPPAVAPSTPAPIANTTGPAPAVSHTPFVIHDLLVREDGTVLHPLPDLTAYDVAVPDGPHRFKVRDVVVDTAADTITKSPPPVTFDHDGKLARIEPDGRVRWTTVLKGVHSVRPPDVAIGGHRVVATIDNTLHAFDDTTGKPVWTSNIDGQRLHVEGDTVYSTMCNEPTHDHWLIATALADGAERFRKPLPMGCDPSFTVDNGLLILVESHPAQTLIFDLAGQQLAKLDEQTQAVSGNASRPLGKTMLLVTDKHLMAIDATARVLWTHDPLKNTFVSGNQLAELPNGDVVIANYGAINDSGVDLIRLHPDGSIAWRSCAAALGVGHSEYEHFAYIEVRGDELFVVSQGSYGAFLEKLSVVTGARERRCVFGGDQGVAVGCTQPAPCR